MPVGEPAYCPFASYVFAKDCGNSIALIQGADAVGIWHYKNGGFGGFANQTLEYDRYNLQRLAELKLVHGNTCFGYFLDELAIRRHNAFNNSFSIFCGRNGIEKKCQQATLLKEDVDFIMLGSDGVTVQDATADMTAYAVELFGDYKVFGAEGLIEKSRKIAALKNLTAHEPKQEAALLVIEP